MSLVEHGELVRRALEFVLEERRENPQKKVSDIMDEAGMRFNLTPLDTQALRRLFEESRAEKPVS